MSFTTQVCVVMVLMGILLVGASFMEARRLGRADEVPQEMTCAELIDEGYGDNAHVVMSDFVLLTCAYVYGEKLRWTEAWVPAVPRGSEVHQAFKPALRGEPIQGSLPADQIKLIVLLNEAHNKYDVERAAEQKTIQGIVLKSVKAVDREERTIMEETYPGLDWDACLIFSAGQEPVTKSKITWMRLGGIGLAFFGGLILYGQRKGERRGR